MTTAEAVAALAESLGYQLRDVAHLDVTPTRVIVTHVDRDAAGHIITRAGFPQTTATAHGWSA